MKLSCVLWVSSALFTTLQAQNITGTISETPECALGCVVSGLSTYNCTIAELGTCLCGSIPFQSELSTCVQQSCSFQDEIKAVTVADALCAGTPMQSRSSEIIRDCIIMSAVTYPLVALRCFSRWKITRQLWWDDWAAVAATLVLIITTGLEISGASHGFGHHYWDITLTEGTIILKLFYVTQMLYILVQVFAKLSLLLLYHRVFPAPWFKLATKLMIVFVVSHGIAFFLVIVFQCAPLASIWDKSITPSHCVNLAAVVYAGAALSIAEDFMILVLPISELNTLSFGVRKRAGLMAMFGVGSFACVTSMVRLKYIIEFSNSTDTTWDQVDVVIWSMIEIYTALICACLPSLRPLMIRYLPSLFRSTYGGGGRTPASLTIPGGPIPGGGSNGRAGSAGHKLSTWRPLGDGESREGGEFRGRGFGGGSSGTFGGRSGDDACMRDSTVVGSTVVGGTTIGVGSQDEFCSKDSWLVVEDEGEEDAEVLEHDRERDWQWETDPEPEREREYQQRVGEDSEVGNQEEMVGRAVTVAWVQPHEVQRPGPALVRSWHEL